MTDSTVRPRGGGVSSFDTRFPPHRDRGVGAAAASEPTESDALSAVDRQRALEAAVAGPVGLLVVDESWRCIWANRSAAALVGREPAGLKSVPWLHFVAARDVPGVANALVAVRHTGERTVVGHEVEPFYARDRAVELAIVPMDPDHRGLPRFSVAVTDVSERRRNERRLQDRALYDGLTGLPNRATVVARVAAGLERRRPGESVVVTFVDLDGFKPINEVHGHPAGDQVLCAVARRLRLAEGEGEMIGRVGGDEFVGCGGPGRADPGGLALRILRSLAEPISIADGQTATIGASVGVAVADDSRPDLSADDLIGRADAAMYSAKRMGGGRFVLDREAEILHGPGPLVSRGN